MSNDELDAFLWVEQNLVKAMTQGHIDPALAKPRAEIATAMAFNVEPANWAKREIGILVEFEAKRDEVERRLSAAQKHSGDVERDMISKSGKDFNPLKNAMIYWYQDTRKQDPNNPYSMAIEAERKIEYEREQLYHQYGRETPEERLGGGIAILLGTLMLGAAGGEAALAGEAEAALASLGEAEAALAVTESQAALASIMEARAALISAERHQAALAAVGEARAAVVAGDLETAAAAVKDARGALSTKLEANPSAALALVAMDKAETKLNAAEKADADLAVSEKTRIDLFDAASIHRREVVDFLAVDLRVAIDYARQYRAFVAEGKIVPKQGRGNVARTGCPQPLH